MPSIENRLDSWLGSSISGWPRFAISSDPRSEVYTMGETLLSNPDIADLPKVKAKWLEVNARFINSHRYAPKLLGNAGGPMYNSIHLGKARVLMAGLIASDPANIVDYLDNTDVDPSGNTKFGPMMKAIVNDSYSVGGSEIGFNRDIHQRLCAAITQLGADLTELKEGDYSKAENREAITKKAHLLGYFLGGLEAAYVALYKEEIARNKARADLLVDIAGLVTIPQPVLPFITINLRSVASKIVTALAKRGMKSVSGQEGVNLFATRISSFQVFYRIIINADSNYWLDHLILPKYEYVLSQNSQLRDLQQN